MNDDKRGRFSWLNVLAVLCVVAIAAGPLVVDVTRLDGA